LGRSLAVALGVEALPGREWRSRLHPRAGDLVLLAVPDPALAGLARELAAERPPPGVAFVHLSGALGLDVLQPLRSSGSSVGSFHPLQSFPVERPARAFAGSLVAIEAGEPGLEAELEGLARRLGAVPRVVPAEQRALYHAAAVLASNYLVALAAQACATLEAAGWTRADALGALLPLMRGVLENLEASGLPEALIGPIRRGDPATVERHLQALQGTGLPERIYRILGLAALELAREAGLDAAAGDRVKEALTG